MMYQLRDYQQTAVDNVVKFFKKSKAPAAVVLPTGSGKSLVIAELARIAKGRVRVPPSCSKGSQRFQIKKPGVKKLRRV